MGKFVSRYFKGGYTLALKTLSFFGKIIPNASQNIFPKHLLVKALGGRYNIAMNVQLVRSRIDHAALTKLAGENYGEMIKGVVDVTREIVALGGELHADAQAALLRDGSRPEDIWGFNIYVEKPRRQRMDYTSFINVRPSAGNRSMEVQDHVLRKRMRDIVDSLVG